MNYHGLLDWRLGISTLRVMLDDKFCAGVDGNFAAGLELHDWLKDAQKTAQQFAKGVGLIQENDFELPVLTTKRQSQFIVVVHPFWRYDLASLPEDHWITEKIFEIIVAAGNDKSKLKFIDSFNLQRRPGWCYQKIFKLP